MITVNFYWAVSLFVLVIIGISIILGIKERKERKRRTSLEDRFIWHCSVCTYTYINTREENISVCPRCGSYNKR